MVACAAIVEAIRFDLLDFRVPVFHSGEEEHGHVQRDVGDMHRGADSELAVGSTGARCEHEAGVGDWNRGSEAGTTRVRFSTAASRLEYGDSSA
jgi:hypothetical protein